MQINTRPDGQAELTTGPDAYLVAQADGSYVDDAPFGGRWRPNDEAAAEIAASDNPAETAVRLCHETPMRGTWHQ